MSLLLPKSSDNYCKYRLRLSLRGRFRPWQSLQKRRDCGACSEQSEESPSLLRLRLATSLAMTILIAGFEYYEIVKNYLLAISCVRIFHVYRKKDYLFREAWQFLNPLPQRGSLT